MIEMTIETHQRREMVDITAKITAALARARIEDGVCHIFVPHTTAAVVINENADPDVVHDLLSAWGKLVPPIRFAHAEGNSDAHFLSSVLGPSLFVPVAGGRLLLGTWQGVFFVELDGPRSRHVRLTCIQAQPTI